MRVNHFLTGTLAAAAMLVASCATQKMAQNNSADDVYNTTAQARVYKYAPPAQTAQIDTSQYDANYRPSDQNYDMDYASRIDRFYYGSPNRVYFDDYYNVYGYNSWYNPYDWSLGFNYGWGFNRWMNPFSSWAFYGSPYYWNTWGPYSYWGGGLGWGAGFGGGYWGGGGWGGNVIVRNNAAITLNENFTSIENLTIENGSSFLLRTSGSSPFTGNIVNNGTFGAGALVTTSQLLMIGTQPQTISGTGTFADFGAISIGTDANVTLSNSLNLMGSSTSSVSGTINFATSSITGNGDFAIREKYIITNTNATVNAGSAVITLPAAEYGSAGVALGVLVEGPGVPANSYIVGTNSAAYQFTISNMATANGTTVSLITKPHLITANAAGIDGSVQTVNAKAFGTGASYTFNAATATPFTTNSNNVLGNVTFNAAATTNKSVSIGGVLTLNNAKLTVNEGDNLTLEPTATLNGTFNNTAYIVTAANAATGAVGTLKLNGLSANTLIPVGTPANFLPVTLSPATASDVEINVFTGATADATPNGTALTAAQKLRMVDAVWNINRTSGTGNVDLTLGWDNTLEGADFSGFTSAQIGIAGYTAGNYGMFTGTGDAGANTVALSTSTFLPFIVGEANTTLPLTLISFTAKESLNSVKLAWQTTDEVNLKNYVLQHRRGNDFQDIYTVAANNKPGVFNYNYTHLNPTAGTNYYRLVGVDFDGSKQTSNPIPVTVTLGNEVTVYPNPVTQKNISVSGVIKGDVIRILNIQGQVVFTKTASGNQVEEINVQNIQAGTYILSIENSGRITSTKKLIKI